MRFPAHPLIALALLFGPAASARADIVTVVATSNIFGAGHSTAPNPGGGSAGTLPTAFSIAPGSGLTLEVTSVTGTVSLTPGHPSNGEGSPDFATNISSYNGISGIIDPNRSGFLVGVFVGASEPADPAPARLTFANSDAYTSLSPLLDQTFLIGTGSTTGGLVTFHIPVGATALYLGFADANSYAGLPGQYQDNSGSLQVTLGVAPVPEPTSMALLGIGSLGLLGGVLRRRSRNVP